MEHTATTPTIRPTTTPAGYSQRTRRHHLELLAADPPAAYEPATSARSSEHMPSPPAHTARPSAVPAVSRTAPAAATPSEPPAGQAPFGCPVLDELPELAATLQRVAAADRLLVDAVLGLRGLLDEGRVEATTGIGIEHWLAATSRMAGLDRRTLRRMCRLLDRLPALADGAAAGRVSFTQLRALTLELRQAPTVIDGPLDTWLAAAIDQLPDDADPDILVRQAARAADELAPQLLDDQTDDDHTHARGLVIQPNLTATGGTFHGTEDALGLAILEAATTPRPDQLDNTARARADNLRAHLCHTLDTDDQARPETPDAVPATSPAIPDASPEPASDAAGLEGPAVPVGPPTLLLRWDYQALLDHTATPAELLTRLVGGRLRLSSRHARQLIETRGARIRSLIVDDGHIIGVGRATRIPPGWLKEAVLAIHDTCTGPLCDRPALSAQIDHATPWHPDPDGRTGTTDLDNLGPLCPTTNRNRRATGWRLTQTHTGTRSWHHPRAGIRITSLPTTWRPHGLPPPPSRPSYTPERTNRRTPLPPPDHADDDPF